MGDTCSTALPRYQVAGSRHRAPSRFMTLVALVLMAISVGACTRTAIDIDPLQRARIKDFPRVGAVHFKAPGLKVHTFGTAFNAQLLGPLVGPFHASGNSYKLGLQIANASGLEDPTVGLKAHFITSVTAQLGLASVEDVPLSTTREDFPVLRDKFRDGVAFGFASTKVELSFLPLSPTRYHLLYEGEGVLWNFKDNDDLWRSSCDLVVKDLSPSPTLDEVVSFPVKETVSKENFRRFVGR